jgi:hypothetical protein
MTGWTIAKYVLALLGVALVLLAENIGARWVGYAGLVPIVVAFLLRFPQRRMQKRD